MNTNRFVRLLPFSGVALCCCLALPSQSPWTLLPQVNAPAARSSAWMMAFDTSSDRCVLFGGSGNGAYLADTQLFNCAANTWTVGPTGPSGRAYHTMTYDAARGEVILFGGELANGNLQNDTWAFTGVWTPRAPSQAPSARWGHSAVYDSGRNRIVLFGGTTNQANQRDTWEWNGVTWIPTGAAFAWTARRQAAIAYDPIRQETVMFGGRDASTFFPGTFVWNGTLWRIVTPATGPSGRAGGAMCYDASRDRVVLHGGATGNGNAVSDTWFWDGSTWSQQFPGGSPGAATHSSIVFDPIRNRLLMFGGNVGNSQMRNDLFAFAPVNPARFDSLGAGCPGNPLAPTLTRADHRLPWIGDTFGVRIGNLPAAGGVCLLVLGTNTTTWNGQSLPLNLASRGMPGCLLRVAPLDTVFFFHTGADMTWQRAVPNSMALVGATFHLQAGAMNTVFANPLGALAGDAATVVLGAR